jgi:hypothetical protein
MQINPTRHTINAATKDTQFSKSWEPLDGFFRKMLYQINH